MISLVTFFLVFQKKYKIRRFADRSLSQWFEIRVDKIAYKRKIHDQFFILIDDNNGNYNVI